MIAISQRSLMTQAMKSVVVENKPSPAARPSRPSIRFECVAHADEPDQREDRGKGAQLDEFPLRGLEIAVIWYPLKIEIERGESLHDELGAAARLDVVDERRRR